MSYGELNRAITMEAGTAVSPYRFLTIAADGQVDHAGVAQGRVDGISAEGQDTVGRSVPMYVPDGGICKVQAGGSASRGGQVATDNAGKAIALGAGNGNLSWGIFMEDAVDGKIVSIQFTNKGQVNA